MITDFETGNKAHYNDAWAASLTAIHSGSNEIGWQALGPAIACTSVATVVVALRWYTRHKIVRCTGFDDYVILLSMVLAWAICILIGVEVHDGLGVYRGRVVDAGSLAKLIVANNDIWALTVNATKASILIQYLRIFSGRAARTCSYILLFLLLPAVCWSIFAGTFLCRPVAKVWNPTLPGHCLVDAQQYWLSAAGINICLDFLTLLLPLPAITSLRLPRKQKICLVLVFMLGFFVCTISVVRLAMVYIYAKKGDSIGSGIWAILWSSVEANVGIICASLMALKPLVAKWCPNLLVETSLPSHSMTLPNMEESGWRRDDSLAGTLVSPRSTISPTAPVLGKELAYTGSLSRPESGSTLTRKETSDSLGFWDMLQERMGHDEAGLV